MHYKTIIHEKKGQVCSITLNRPEVDNAINTQMAKEIADACQRINQDDEISVVVLKGAGGSFCSGKELKEISEIRDTSGDIASLERVTIAAIDGAALGDGFELALACDIRIASERASFCLPHAAHGLIPCGGGTQRLPRLIGKGKALEMVLTAEPIDAQEAFRIGLVSKIVPAEKLLQEVEELVGRITSHGPIALRYAREAVHKGMDLTLEQGLRLEADLYFLIQTPTDRMEGIRAFKEKRPPQFKGV
jgi:enoyl-CoA hydratase/carnithine racemase